LNTKREGIYAESFIDLITFRRVFVLSGQSKAENTLSQLTALAQPPPMSANPFESSLSVAVTQTVSDKVVFEAYIMRGFPTGGTYTTLVVTGYATDDKNIITLQGEIRPTQQGMMLYSILIMMLLLWAVVMLIMSVSSSIVTMIPVMVALGVAALVTVIVYTMTLTDLRRLIHTLNALI